MKKIFLILIFITYLDCYSQDSEKATLTIIKNGDSKGNIGSVDCVVKNTSEDTLIYVNYIYLQNIWLNSSQSTGKEFYFMSTDTYYNPNVLYFYDKKGGLNLQGDGYTFFNFNNFPKFFILAPGKELSIHVDLKNYSNSLKGKDFLIDGVFYLAYKSNIDSVISNYMPSEKSNYENSLYYRENINYYDYLDNSLTNSNKLKLENIEHVGRQFQIRLSCRLI